MPSSSRTLETPPPPESRPRPPPAAGGPSPFAALLAFTALSSTNRSPKWPELGPVRKPTAPTVPVGRVVSRHPKVHWPRHVQFYAGRVEPNRQRSFAK